MRFPALLAATASLVLLAATASVLRSQTPPNPVVIDNDQVRVLKVSDLPHHKGQLHEHLMNRVMIYLNAGHMVLQYENGKTDDQQVKAGEVRWSKAGGKHISENVGDAPVEIVEIELKSKPGGASKPITAALDTLKVEPTVYTKLFENDQVRVVRAKLAPHAKVKQHEHTLNRVQVFLTDFTIKVTAADGTVKQIARKAGEVVFAPPAKHEEENLAATPAEVILVELKK
jgi:quercetin dioxygenase-like cupin family protein